MVLILSFEICNLMKRAHLMTHIESVSRHLGTSEVLHTPTESPKPEDLKAAIHFVSDKWDKPLPIRHKISQMSSVVKRQEGEKTWKNQRIDKIESRLGDLEQHSHLKTQASPVWKAITDGNSTVATP